VQLRFRFQICRAEALKAPQAKKVLTGRVDLVDIRRLHAVLAEDLDELVPQGGDVLPNFHHVVLGDAEVVGLALLGRDVTPDQEPHDRLVTLLRLFP
jgi:hypothetical protein